MDGATGAIGKWMTSICSEENQGICQTNRGSSNFKVQLDHFLL